MVNVSGLKGGLLFPLLFLLTEHKPVKGEKTVTDFWCSHCEHDKLQEGRSLLLLLFFKMNRSFVCTCQDISVFRILLCS